MESIKHAINALLRLWSWKILVGVKFDHYKSLNFPRIFNKILLTIIIRCFVIAEVYFYLSSKVLILRVLAKNFSNHAIRKDKTNLIADNHYFLGVWILKSEWISHISFSCFKFNAKRWKTNPKYLKYDFTFLMQRTFLIVKHYYIARKNRFEVFIFWLFNNKFSI